MSTKTVKPAGGGDFSTLQGWEDWADDQATADQWAECYAGSLGVVNLSGWASTPTSTVYPRIYTPLSERHNGVGGVTNGAYIQTSANSQTLLSSYTKFVHVEGIRFILQHANVTGIYMDWYTGRGGYAYDNIVEARTGCSGSSFGITAGLISATADGIAIAYVLRNNIVLCNNLMPWGIYLKTTHVGGK